LATQKTTMRVQEQEIDALKKEKAILEQRVIILQQQLIKLRELL